VAIVGSSFRSLCALSSLSLVSFTMKLRKLPVIGVGLLLSVPLNYVSKSSTFHVCESQVTFAQHLLGFW